jgi:hypothetical protein
MFKKEFFYFVFGSFFLKTSPKALKRNDILRAWGLLKIILCYLKERAAGGFFCKKVFSFILGVAAKAITKVAIIRWKIHMQVVLQ